SDGALPIFNHPANLRFGSDRPYGFPYDRLNMRIQPDAADHFGHGLLKPESRNDFGSLLYDRSFFYPDIGLYVKIKLSSTSDLDFLRSEEHTSELQSRENLV